MKRFVKRCEYCGKTFVSRSVSKKYCSCDCKSESIREKREGAGQLCWRCKNACGGCSWSKNLTPVDGWVAEKFIIKDSEGDLDSYDIQACPEFIYG